METLKKIVTNQYFPAGAVLTAVLLFWAVGGALRGLRNDCITLRLTRAEIGNYLGMTLESVSRALSRMARGQVIAFADKARRDIQIPRVDALTHFIQEVRSPEGVAAH